LKISQNSIDNITSGLFISNANYVSGLQWRWLIWMRY